MPKLTHMETGEVIDLPELIELQSANAAQVADNGVKQNWRICKNITGEVLHTFQPNIPDQLMFGILNFARTYELKAFNAGITYQKKKQNVLMHEQIQQLTAINAELGAENIRLATILEKLLPEE